MTHLDWSKDGEKLQSTSTDYELLFCKSIILKLILTLYYLHIALPAKFILARLYFHMRVSGVEGLTEIMKALLRLSLWTFIQ